MFLQMAHHATSGDNGLSSDISGVVGAKERRDAGDLTAFAESAQRYLGERLIGDILVARQGRAEFRFYDSRGYSIDANVFVTNGSGNHFGQTQQRGFAHGIRAK